MISQKFKEVMGFVVSELEELNQEWAFIGSTNLAIHGMDVEPNDLDLITSVKGIEEVEEIFSEHVDKGVTEVNSGDDFPDFYELELDVDGVEVHFLGGYDEDVYFSKVNKGRTETVEVDGLEVSCLTLRAEAEAYEMTGRKEKGERVKEYIRKL